MRRSDEPGAHDELRWLVYLGAYLMSIAATALVVLLFVVFAGGL